MNDPARQTDTSPPPGEAGEESSSQTPPATTDQPSLSDQGRALVVVEPADTSEGWFTRFMIKLGLRSSGSLRDDLHEALSGEGQAGNVFSPEERDMLQNILRLRELRVEDVMVNRSDVHAVDINTTLGVLLQTFDETGHSRLPVYDDTLDDPRGMVLIKDLLVYITKQAAKGSRSNGDGHRALNLEKINLDITLAKLKVMRSVLFVPPSMLASDLMARMQATRTQMALVIDEYGGTDGLVTLEDIVEEVVGDIEDEHDEDEVNQVALQNEGIWAVDARVEIEKLAEAIGPAFDVGERGDDVDTLGGLVFSLAGHVPVRGEVITGVPGFEFRVIDADPRRVKRLQVVQTSLREKRRKAAAAE